LDHNWGRTIWDMGLAAAGATLAARDLTYPWIVLTNAPSPGHPDRTLWFITRMTSDLAFDTFDNLTFGLPFPYIYGGLVEPDGPV